MKVLKENLEWKPVKLEGAICNDNLEQFGLIGIEELTDYQFDSSNDAEDSENTTEKPSKKKKKRKISEPDDDISDTEDAPAEKSKIKKTKLDKHIKVNYVLSQERLSSIQNQLNKRAKKPKQKEKIKVEVGATATNPETSCPVEDLTEWMNYGLSSEILKALAEQGFRKPTVIQSLTLPPAIFGCRDILGAAETGSGKTLAFGLPIINAIMKLKSSLDDPESVTADGNVSESENGSDDEQNEDDCDPDAIGFVKSVDKIAKSDGELKLKPLYALILTPTRELAVQIKNHLISVARYTGIRVAVVVGGMAAVKQERILSKSPEIVVATPGRLWELVQNGNPHLSQIDSIRYLVIDETDRMMEHGHFDELHQLLDRLNVDEERKKQRQTFVFSATLTLVHELPKHLARKKWLKGKIHKLTPGQKLQKVITMLGITDPKVVDITKDTGTASTLTECRITCPIEDKDYYLYYFLKRHPGRTIIFCNSIGCVKRLNTLFTVLECNPLPLHAMMQQRQRLKNLERFRDDNLGILIATDVAARGLDIPKVQHVIHYQCPRTAENYVHRSGRTARAEEEGITVLFMEPTELKSYIRLCRTLGRAEDLPIFPVDDKLLSRVKQRINLARDLDVLELRFKKKNAEAGWFQKAIAEMDIVVDEYDMPSQVFDDEEVSKTKRTIDAKRKQLALLLSKPLFPRGFSAKYLTSNVSADGSVVPKVESKKNAIEVMKSALENYARSGKTIGKLAPKYKAKKATSMRKKKRERWNKRPIDKKKTV